jgi:flagellin
VSTAAAGFLVGDNTESQATIEKLDTAIANVSKGRSELGANQNRFESAINSLAVSKENLTAAESRIRDTDMAAEMVNYTRSNILSQAGTAMLAQANQSNQGVLQLLG